MTACVSSHVSVANSPCVCSGEILSRVQGARRWQEDIEDKYEALFDVWNKICIKASNNQWQPIPSRDQGVESTRIRDKPYTSWRDRETEDMTTLNHGPTDEREDNEEQGATNLIPTTEESWRHALAGFGLVEGARGWDTSQLAQQSWVWCYDPLELYARNISGVINIYRNRETMDIIID